MGLTVRPRAGGDLDRVVEILAAVQVNDGYPGRAPRDLRAFLASDDALASWVAEHDGRVVGHVALHPTSLPVVMELASSTVGRPPEELAVVVRLIVDPQTRRLGVGRALLDAAAEESWRRGCHPILDVVTEYDAATALYGSCGWTNAGEVTMRFGDGTTLLSYVFVAPS